MKKASNFLWRLFSLFLLFQKNLIFQSLNFAGFKLFSELIQFLRFSAKHFIFVPFPSIDEIRSSRGLFLTLIQ